MSDAVVFIAGSPSPSSRSSFVSRLVRELVERAGLTTTTWSLHDFDAADVLLGRSEAAGPRRLVEAVKGAAGIVLSSPVYKATYAGGLKALVDLIPPDALVERPVLGIATTRSPAHVEEVARAYRALFSFFHARAIEPLVVLDEELRVDGAKQSLARTAEAHVEEAARSLVDAIRRR